MQAKNKGSKTALALLKHIYPYGKSRLPTSFLETSKVQKIFETRKLFNNYFVGNRNFISLIFRLLHDTIALRVSTLQPRKQTESPRFGSKSW